MPWAPQTVVIGPHGILDVANMSATQETLFASISRIGQTLLLE